MTKARKVVEEKVDVWAIVWVLCVMSAFAFLWRVWHIMFMNTSDFVKKKDVVAIVERVDSLWSGLGDVRWDVRDLKTDLHSTTKTVKENEMRLRWESAKINRAWNLLMEDMNREWWCTWETIPFKVTSESKKANWVSDYYVVSYFDAGTVRLPSWNKKEVLCLIGDELLDNDH